MRFLISLKYSTNGTIKPSVLSPLVNQVLCDPVAGTALFEVFASASILPFEKVLHLVCDSVTLIDYNSPIAVTDEQGNGYLFFVDIAAGISTAFKRFNK